MRLIILALLITGCGKGNRCDSVEAENRELIAEHNGRMEWAHLITFKDSGNSKSNKNCPYRISAYSDAKKCVYEVDAVGRLETASQVGCLEEIYEIENSDMDGHVIHGLWPNDGWEINVEVLDD